MALEWMAEARAFHSATSSANGNVLVGGRRQRAAAPTTTSLTRAIQRGFGDVDSGGEVDRGAQQSRWGLLGDGTALVVGGSNLFGTVSDADRYDAGSPAPGSGLRR